MGWSRNNEATVVTQHFNAMEYTNVTIVRLEIFDHNQSLVLLHMLLWLQPFSSLSDLFHPLQPNSDIYFIHYIHEGWTVSPVPCISTVSSLCCTSKRTSSDSRSGLSPDRNHLAAWKSVRALRASRLSAHLLRTVPPAVICVSPLCKYFILPSFISLSMLYHSSYKNIQRTAVLCHAQTHIQTDLTRVLMGNRLCCGQTYRGKNIKNKQQTNVLEALMSHWSEN